MPYGAVEPLGLIPHCCAYLAVLGEMRMTVNRVRIFYSLGRSVCCVGHVKCMSATWRQFDTANNSRRPIGLIGKVDKDV